MASVQKPQENHNNNIIGENRRTNKKLLYKALTLTLFLIVLPLFPSQAPEFVNQALITRRSWELLHLLFVGLAVSYGLFSRRNDAVSPKKPPPADHEPHVISRLLEVSSVFDDHEDDRDETSRSLKAVQTSWSSQYHRNDADLVLVAPEEKADHKPLLLPVRSLKETSPSSRASSASTVLPSPIPWRSRSGRFETTAAKVNNESMSSSLRLSQSSRFDSPLPAESPAKASVDFVRKNKSFNKKSTHPPPPPPPPPTFSSHLSAKTGSGFGTKPVTAAFGGEEEGLVGKVLMESDAEESESEEDNEIQREHNIDGQSSKQSSEEKNNNNNNNNIAEEESGSSGGGGGDVDKKADEFIAKFREQIRLQRIESIKRSSAQMSKNLST